MTKKQNITVWCDGEWQDLAPDGAVTLTLTIKVCVTHAELLTGEWLDQATEQFNTQANYAVRVLP
jgi:hypothetical protein